MNTSREAFEQWARNDSRNFVLTTGGTVPDRYISGLTRDAERDWNDAWQACDAHWREKLQSEEMARVMLKTVVYLSAGHSLTNEVGDVLVSSRNPINLTKGLAAIGKEMGV